MAGIKAKSEFFRAVKAGNLKAIDEYLSRNPKRYTPIPGLCSQLTAGLSARRQADHTTT
jgi:hypothetical protein